MAIAVAPRPAPAAARITATEFLTHPAESGRSELVRGELRVRPLVGGCRARIAAAVFVALDTRVLARGLGEMFASNVGFALPPGDDTVRSPDAAFVSAGRLPADDLPAGWVPIAPDLVVEVLSADETHSMVMQQLDDYFAGGTALAWVIDPRRRGVEVHTAARAVGWVAQHETLDGAPVLPEFALPVAAPFAGVGHTAGAPAGDAPAA